jgi:hypothetical protein
MLWLLVALRFVDLTQIATRASASRALGPN